MKKFFIGILLISFFILFMGSKESNKHSIFFDENGNFSLSFLQDPLSDQIELSLYYTKKTNSQKNSEKFVLENYDYHLNMSSFGLSMNSYIFRELNGLIIEKNSESLYFKKNNKIFLSFAFGEGKNFLLNGELYRSDPIFFKVFSSILPPIEEKELIGFYQ